MKRCDRKKRDQNEKDAKHKWRAISFEKETFWFLNFKNNVNYTISISWYFFNSILVKKIISFLLFFGYWLKEDRQQLKKNGNLNCILLRLKFSNSHRDGNWTQRLKLGFFFRSSPTILVFFPTIFFFCWFTWGVRASLRAPRLFPTAHWTSCKPRSR